MSFLSILDRHHFLGFKIWEFSFRSLLKDYGLLFIFKVFLRHPLKSSFGLIQYRKIRKRFKEDDTVSLLKTTRNSFLDQIVERDEGILVALGYCQKPIKNNGNSKGCPSGLFNHDCLFLSTLDLKNPKADFPAPECRTCEIGILGKKTLCAGGFIHIMTSARDMIYDIFLPSIKEKRFSHAIFLICPYSAEPIILPLLICDIKSILVKYTKGECRDFDDFTKADRGLKGERTSTDKSSMNEIHHILDYIISFREREQLPSPSRFERTGNLFAPKF